MDERRGIIRAATPALLAGLLMAAWGPAARADLVLTAAGKAQGLGLSTFASNFPGNALGIAFPTTGGVLVNDNQGNIRRFATDTDGQNAATVPVSQNYGGLNAFGLARVGSNIYMSQFINGTVVQISDDGTFRGNIVSGVSHAAGLATNPLNNHLFVAAQGTNQIFDVDPIARTSTFFANATFPDGVSVSPDGKTVYVAAAGTNNVLGFNTSTGATVFDSGVIPGGVDGTAAGIGLFANDLFVDLNNGTVVEIDLITKIQTLIATGGTRGDLATVDTTNGTLLLVDANKVVRLTGATFVPEPASLALTTAGAAGLLAATRLRRRRTA